MATSSKNESRIWWRWGAALAVLLPGSYFAWRTVSPAFPAWYIREDSRFFSNGIFSFYDLWSAFSTRQNSMGQYRPVIRLLWGIPAWLGAFDPYAYHWVSFLMLFLTALALARLVFLYGGRVYPALWSGAVLMILPVNEKPLFWISAWHNSAVSLFLVAAFVFRVELWRRERPIFRLLCAVSFFLALASREVAFPAAVVLVAIDWLEARERGVWQLVRRSWDFAAIAVLLFAWLFLIESPLQRTGLKISVPGPAEMASLFWRYAYNAFWATSDVLAEVPAGAFAIATGAMLALTAIAPLFKRSLALGALLAVLGAAPFLLLGSGSVEYGGTMSLGIVFALGGLLSLLDEKLPGWAAAAPFALSIVALTLLFDGGSEARRFYLGEFTKTSRALEQFVGALRTYSDSQPPHRAIEIVDVGPIRREALSETMHFLHPGLDELIPDRVFLFTNETLGINDGTGLNDPTNAFWRVQMKEAVPPIRAHYVAGVFRSVP